MIDKKGMRYLVPSFLAVTAVVTGLNGGLSSAKALVPDFSPAYAADIKSTGKATKEKKADTSSSKTTTPYKASGDLSQCADGTYYGNGQGYAGNIKVKVVIKDHEMKSIDIVEVEADDAPYVAKAKGVISAMLRTQSLNVDTVSGATYSSNGIIKAVEDALAQAAGKASSGNSKSSKSKSKNNKKESPSVSHDPSLDGQKFQDGVYTGTAEGYNGDLTVAVTIKNGKITKIIIKETGDDEEYLNMAKAVIKRIIATQSTNVDTVSGATFSSVGIIGAVEDALKKAVKTPEDSASDKEDNSADQEGSTEVGDGEDSEEPAEPGEGVIYQNGTYTGTALCTDGDEFWYAINVQITVAGDKITEVKVIDNSSDTSEGGWAENVKYINWVINGRMGVTGVPTQIVNQGLPEGIDTIAGATYSSNSVISACQVALKKAKIQ